MERLKLSSGKELKLIVCGILADSKTVTIKFLPETNTLNDLNTLLMNTVETEKMILLSEGGDELSIYNGYTRLQSLSQEPETVIGHTQENEPITGKLITAVLCKPDEIQKRVTALEETVDIVVGEMLGM